MAGAGRDAGPDRRPKSCACRCRSTPRTSFAGSAVCTSRPISTTWFVTCCSTMGLPQVWGCEHQEGYFRVCSLTGGGCVAWIVRLVQIGAEGEGQATDVIEIDRPDDLGDIADLGLTLAEAKLLLAGLQQEIVTAQARDHAVWRPACRRCGGVCRVKDNRDHAVATLFGHVTVRLPRFCCAACGGIEGGVGWPTHCR